VTVGASKTVNRELRVTVNITECLRRQSHSSRAQSPQKRYEMKNMSRNLRRSGKRVSSIDCAISVPPVNPDGNK
jgi:hypothetical protein